MLRREPVHPARPINYAALAEVLMLMGTAALLLVTWERGTLAYYIHPRYTILVLLAALMLFLMGGARLRDIFRPQPGQHLSVLHLMLALPLLLGVLVPAQPLGADTLAGRGLDLTMAPLPGQVVTGDPAEWNLLQWALALPVQGEDLQGETVDVVGFVFQDTSIDQDGFYVVRYVITCCAADGAAAALPVIWPGGEALPADTWVQVQGRLATITLSDGQIRPAVAATSVEPVVQPESPYLFP